MPKVELIYDRDCPNVGPARGQLLRAFAEAGGMPARWREWRRDDPDAPDYVRHYGSPTVLIDGRDIQPVEAGGDNCRIYALPGGGHGPVPAAAMIAGHLWGAYGRHFDWRASGIWGPAMGVAFLPKLVCPACWPAYAAVARSLGLSFLLQSQYLLPITLLALALILGLLVWRAPARHGYGPSWLGLASGTAIVIGKFFYQSNPVAYAGAGLLLAACLWNSWPVSRRRAAGCSDCKPSEPE